MAADSAGREKDLRALLAQLGIENRVQTQLTRDARGSLEVFDPSRKTIKTIAGPSSVRFEEKSEDQHEGNVELRKKELEDDEKNRNPSKIEKKIGAVKEVEAAAKRAAEWGLILKADAGSTTITGVEARRSREDKPNNALGASRTSGDSDTGNEVDDYKRIPRLSKELKDVLSSFEQTFVVADALDPNHPVLYASAGFFTMTGYTPNQVIGKNCRFLQGADTDPVEVAKIRAALNAGEPFCGRLLNYKKNGTAFWNLLTVAPIKDESGKLLKFIGMLVEVSKYTEGGKDRALRPNGLSESLIKYDARQKDKVTSSLSELLDDVQGLFSTKKSRTDYKSGLKEISEAAPIAKEEMKRGRRRSGFFSLFGKPSTTKFPGLETLDEADHMERVKEVRKGIDLATTLERIEKNFVITDPRLPDNPIIFASDSFLELTEYTREEILGRNCRFLQGPGTDPETVQEIRDAIREQKNITVQILNYTKSGKPFWNIFHLQAMRDSKGELQYFIGVQLDGSAHFDPNRKQIPNQVVNQNAPLVQSTAVNVNEALKELPDANMRPNDLWFQYSKSVVPKPHKLHSPSWKAIAKGCDGKNHNGKRFRHIKPLGSGDTGIVHLVELDGAGEMFALKAMKKELLLQRNKVHRACAEREILNMMDHPFLPTLYATFQTTDHICLITDYCSGGELFHLLDKQPSKVFQEKAARFYAAEVVIALEYLHYMGVVYRDLKPENILIQSDGHVQLTDFDLSLLAPPNPQVVHRKPNEIGKHATIPAPTFFAEPVARSNSFVGTEEYIAPEVISGLGHSSAVDWWALGILLYEMLYGHTPFRGKNRQRIFSNILHKSIAFSNHVPVSVAAKELMHELLQKDPSKRLGSHNGAYDIKQHSFFKGINWPLLRNTVPPKLVVSHKEMVHKIDGMTQDARWVDAEKDIFGSSGLF